jgi:methionyl aminopeptidase
MTIDTPDDLNRLKKIGRIVALTIKEMSNHVQPGITTLELDDIAASVLKQYGAHSAPQVAYQFPGVTCISINDEAAHGIPGDRKVEAGDLVNLDVSAELDGVFADAAITVAVPPVSNQKHNLIHCSQRALHLAINASKAGQPINIIGKTVEQEAKNNGFTTLMDLGGHGVGRHIHEEPHDVANFYNPQDTRVLKEGMVFTIEPFITTGARRIYTDKNGWTLKTSDGSLSAQFEHTLVVTHGKPLIVTAL